jgi:hypothetical protein
MRPRILAALLLTLPLSLFGEVLVRQTHHRPLGAATYSSVVVIAFLLCWAAVARLRPRTLARTTAARAAWALGAGGFLVAMSRLIG